MENVTEAPKFKIELTEQEVSTLMDFLAVQEWRKVAGIMNIILPQLQRRAPDEVDVRPLKVEV
jgi:hypothetical protein